MRREHAAKALSELFHAHRDADWMDLADPTRQSRHLLDLSDVISTSKEADLEKNLLASLGMVSLVLMRKYACHAQRFMHAYHDGLDGKDAAWACKKYRGHRVIPSFLLADLDKPNA